MSWSDMPDWFYPYDDKRPDQIQHRLGKSWLYTSLNIRTMTGEEKIIYYKDEESKFMPLLKPDGYCKTTHSKLGYKHYFCEFQINQSGNKWDKDYKTLFNSFSEDQNLTLMIVTTESYEKLREQLLREMKGMKNVSLAFYTLDELRGLCWRIVLNLREKFKQKELT